MKTMLLGMRFLRVLLLLMMVLPGFVAAQAPGLAGIAHVAIRTTDLTRSIAFYEELGFEKAFAFSKDGATTEAFLKVNDRQFVEIYPSPTNGFMHVCFEGADLAALNREYRSHGLAPTPVKRAGAGNLLFTMAGPEQQNIEYTQYMPGSLHANDQGKHLGAQRISERILGVRIPMQDPAAAQAFYEQKLGFPPAQEMVKFGSQFQILFSVADLRRTAAQLKAFHLQVSQHGTNLTIHDPDGNQIVFVGIKAA